ALGSAKVLNGIDPDFIRFRTWVPVPVAPLYKDYKSGKFELLCPHEALQETRLLVENLNVTSYLASDHISNFVNINGRLPESKEKFLAAIDEALKLPRETFRDDIICQL
ncbi:MAG: radical SAM protein, partial [Planctomycetota bacterium]